MNNHIKTLSNGDFRVEPMEKECNPHPNAPHGFLRQASHSAGRFVCECEWWDEMDYELATLEEAEAFAEKRNCPWDDWKANRDIV
jgi:hypothetical protein